VPKTLPTIVFVAFTPEELLECARAGKLETLGVEGGALADAVRGFAEAGDTGSALELVGRGWRVWLVGGDLESGAAAAGSALGAAAGAADVPLWRTRALYADGVLAFRAGDQRRSRARNEEALEIARREGDARGECDALTGLARVALREGDYGAVVALGEQARARARLAGDREAEAGPLHLQAAGVRLQGDYRGARELYLQSLELNRELHNTAWVTMEEHNLGWVELHLGDLEQAAAHFRARDAQGEADAYGDAWSELNWAAVAHERGDASEAQHRFRSGRLALDDLGLTLDPDDQSEFDWLREALSAPR
jgi:tetratricopeptide (TPR) repeat protein